MVSTTLSDGWCLDWGKNAYDENRWAKGEEPRRRQLRVVASSFRSRWHVTLTFAGSLHPDKAVRANRKKRRQDVENLCSCLDFNSLSLLDDTVTELRLTRRHDNTPPYYENDIVDPNSSLPLRSVPHIESEYYSIVNDLQLCIREDPFHVRFPPFDIGTDIPIEQISAVTKCRQLSAGVYEVVIRERASNPYAFKEVDRPLYMPEDSRVLERELNNLQLFRNTQNIVKLVAAVVSPNPYQTIADTNFGGLNKALEVSDSLHQNGLVVLRGILLEYHPNGTLRDALEASQDTPPLKAWPCLKWAFQIASGLACLHARNITHMDLKPSNIIIGAKNEAILIDISGIGGTTHEWLAPEMLDGLDPLSKNMEARVWNDIWALGKIFLQMANASCVGKEQLRNIGLSATVENPFLRRPLPNIVSALFDIGV